MIIIKIIAVAIPHPSIPIVISSFLQLSLAEASKNGPGSYLFSYFTLFSFDIQLFFYLLIFLFHTAHFPLQIRSSFGIIDKEYWR